MNRIEDFFADIDQRWPDRPEQRIELSLIGCGALMLQADYERGTKDSDVFEALSLTKEITECTIDLRQWAAMPGYER